MPLEYRNSFGSCIGGMPLISNVPGSSVSPTFIEDGKLNSGMPPVYSEADEFPAIWVDSANVVAVALTARGAKISSGMKASKSDKPTVEAGAEGKDEERSPEIPPPYELTSDDGLALYTSDDEGVQPPRTSGREIAPALLR